MRALTIILLCVALSGCGMMSLSKPTVIGTEVVSCPTKKPKVTCTPWPAMKIQSLSDLAKAFLMGRQVYMCKDKALETWDRAWEECQKP